MHAIPRLLGSQNWITIVLLCVLILLVIAKIRHTEEFYYFVRILTSKKFFTDRDKRTHGIGSLGFTLYLAQLLVMPLALYFLALNFHLATVGTFLLFVKIFLLYAVLITSKYLLEKIVGNLFSIDTFISRYIFFKISFKNFLAICLFPFLLFLTYSWTAGPRFFQVGLAVFLLLNVLFLRFFYQKWKTVIFQNLFYFILYLCTFEIAPYFIVYKIIA